MVCRASWTGAAAAVGRRRQRIHDLLACYTLRRRFALPIRSGSSGNGLVLFGFARRKLLAFCLQVSFACTRLKLGVRVADNAGFTNLYAKGCEAKAM